MKSLVIGASGLVGAHVMETLTRLGPVTGTAFSRVGNALHPLDIREADAVARIIGSIRPDTVICAAAQPHVDLCERKPERTREINVEGTRNVVAATRAIDSTLVFFSTDYVFDGRNGPYRESDAVNPINEYGKQKVLAEAIVCASTIPGVLLIQPAIHRDDRGWLSEGFKASEFTGVGITDPFVQDNVVWSARRGTLPGLHFQRPPFAQGKLVRCLRGSIVDVIVDLRRGSPTEGKWASFELDADSGLMVWVPTGLAHGYQTLVNDCLITYKTTAEYSPGHELGIRWNDRSLRIVWPIAAAAVSPRDAALPLAADVPSVFEWSA